MKDDPVQDMAAQLAAMLRGELPADAFQWLTGPEKRSLGALGLSWLRGGRADQAREAFNILADLEPDNPVHELMRAHANLNLDNLDAALEGFRKALELAADDPVHQEVAAEAYLGRGDLYLKTSRPDLARADLEAFVQRVDDPVRKERVQRLLDAAQPPSEPPSATSNR